MDIIDLSIVIPTKNRYEYLKGSLQSLSNLKKKYGDKIEIVVQDNSEDNSEFLRFKDSLNFDIAYYYDKSQLSQTENSDKAIFHSKGEYVCFIGDDDSVSESIMDVVNWMKINTVEACIGTIIRFNWPDLKTHFFQFPSFQIPKHDKINSLVNAKKIAKKVLKKGAIDMDLLPKVYHGIVAKKLLNKIYNISGSFSPGPSPDMANAISLAYFVERYAVIDLPFIISGFSYKSAGGQGARHSHHGTINLVKQLPKGTEENWHTKIPKFWSAQTIWAESALTALERIGLANETKKINYNALYASILIFNWSYRKFVFSYIKYNNFLGIAWMLVRLFNKRLKIFLMNLGKYKFQISKEFMVDNVETLEDAVLIANEYIKTQNMQPPVLQNKTH